jgi:glutathione S-transferase
MDYITVEEAAARPGLRLGLTRGLPGPWGLAARAIFDLKGISYAPVAQEAGQSNDALREWTGQNSAPVAVLDEERPRAQWSEILLLAERMQPDPPVIPDDFADRATMFGVCHEICGEDGIGWNARLLIFASQRAAGHEPYPLLIGKYGADTGIDEVVTRLNGLLDMLAARLSAASSAKPYLVGTRLSAADIYWAMFSNLLSALPEEICPMPGFFRKIVGKIGGYLGRPVPELLIAHRDRIIREHVALPLDF